MKYNYFVNFLKLGAITTILSASSLLLSLITGPAKAQFQPRTEFRGAPPVHAVIYEHPDSSGHSIPFWGDGLKDNFLGVCISKSFFGACNAWFDNRASRVFIRYTGSWMTLWDEPWRRGTNIILPGGDRNHILSDYGFDNRAGSARYTGGKLENGHYLLENGALYYLGDTTVCEVGTSERQRINPRLFWNVKGGTTIDMLAEERNFVGPCV